MTSPRCSGKSDSNNWSGRAQNRDRLFGVCRRKIIDVVAVDFATELTNEAAVVVAAELTNGVDAVASIGSPAVSMRSLPSSLPM